MYLIGLLILLIIVLLIIRNKSKGERYDYLGRDIEMIRPNCPQINDRKECVKTLGCRYLIDSNENIELAAANNGAGISGIGCINNYADLRNLEIPEWEKDNFLIVYN
jgi:hypothetical protein